MNGKRVKFNKVDTRKTDVAKGKKIRNQKHVKIHKILIIYFLLLVSAFVLKIEIVCKK